jgi:hypothetical protein
LSFGGKMTEKSNFGNYLIKLGVFRSSSHPLFGFPNFSESPDKCPLRRFLLQVELCSVPSSPSLLCSKGYFKPTGDNLDIGWQWNFCKGKSKKTIV